ncbi:toxin glutamine deamidase domain-containing protein [Kitasatospora sp. NPDC096147]|uniref:toxin glutamine deamidase domain-containing protein n=1 Tax=Kitasatospora sp. NPDC096147 TaxID=3364093 RepID=UPI0037FFAB86
MAVELPEPLQWVLMLLAGSRWPEGDEDLMRDMGRRWRAAAETMDEAGRAADSAMKRALDGQQGSAVEELAKKWDTLTLPADGQKPGFFPGMVKACNSMADSLEAMANSTETAKISIVAQLGILAYEIATAEAAAPVTAGASLAAIPVAIQASKMTVQQILKKLAKEIIILALKEAFQEVAINLLAQSIQLAAGNRKELDGKELGMSAAGGAIGGAAGGVLGKGMGAAGNKLIGKKMDTLPAQMFEGAVTDVGADAFTQFALTGEVDPSGLGGSALSGAGSPAIMRGASALKGKFNSSDIPDASDFTGGGTDGSGVDTPTMGGSGNTNSNESSTTGDGSTNSSSTNNGSTNSGTSGNGTSSSGTGPSTGGNGSSSGSPDSSGSQGSDASGKPDTHSGNDTDVDPANLTPIGADGHHTRSGGADFDTAPIPRGSTSDSTPDAPPRRDPDAPRTFTSPHQETVSPTPDTAPYRGPVNAVDTEGQTPRTLTPYDAPTTSARSFDASSHTPVADVTATHTPPVNTPPVHTPPVDTPPVHTPPVDAPSGQNPAAPPHVPEPSSQHQPSQQQNHQSAPAPAPAPATTPYQGATTSTADNSSVHDGGTRIASGGAVPRSMPHTQQSSTSDVPLVTMPGQTSDLGPQTAAPQAAVPPTAAVPRSVTPTTPTTPVSATTSTPPVAATFSPPTFGTIGLTPTDGAAVGAPADAPVGGQPAADTVLVFDPEATPVRDSKSYSVNGQNVVQPKMVYAMKLLVHTQGIQAYNPFEPGHKDPEDTPDEKRFYGSAANEGLCGGWVELQKRDPDRAAQMWKALVDWTPTAQHAEGSYYGDLENAALAAHPDKASLDAGRRADLERLNALLAPAGLQAQDVAAAVTAAHDFMRVLEPDAGYMGIPESFGTIGDMAHDLVAVPRPEFHSAADFHAEATSDDGVRAEVANRFAQAVHGLPQVPGGYFVHLETPTHHMGVQVRWENGAQVLTVCESEVFGVVRLTDPQHLRTILQASGMLDMPSYSDDEGSDSGTSSDTEDEAPYGYKVYRSTAGDAGADPGVEQNTGAPEFGAVAPGPRLDGVRSPLAQPGRQSPGDDLTTSSAPSVGPEVTTASTLVFGPVQPRSTGEVTTDGDVGGGARKRSFDEAVGKTVPSQDEGPRPIKKARTPAHERSEAVLRDRMREKPTRAQKQALAGHLAEHQKGRFPEPTTALLKLVNPHGTAKPGSDLFNCLENTAALRDTHYGQGAQRPADRPIPQEDNRKLAENAWHLVKQPAGLHPKRFGNGQDGIDALVQQVTDAGPGAFSTVLTGQPVGHAFALVHGRDKDGNSTLNWVDPSTHEVMPVEPGKLPKYMAPGSPVWAATTDQDGETVPGGRLDHSLFGGSAEYGAVTYTPGAPERDSENYPVNGQDVTQAKMVYAAKLLVHFQGQEGVDYDPFDPENDVPFDDPVKSYYSHVMLNGLCGGWVEVQRRRPETVAAVWEAMSRWDPEARYAEGTFGKYGDRADALDALYENNPQGLRAARQQDLDDLNALLAEVSGGTLDARAAVGVLTSAQDLMALHEDGDSDSPSEAEPQEQGTEDGQGSEQGEGSEDGDGSEDSEDEGPNYPPTPFPLRQLGGTDAIVGTPDLELVTAVEMEATEEPIETRFAQVVTALQPDGGPGYYVHFETPSHHMGVEVRWNGDDQVLTVCESETSGLVRLTDPAHLEDVFQNSNELGHEGHVGPDAPYGYKVFRLSEQPADQQDAPSPDGPPAKKGGFGSLPDGADRDRSQPPAASSRAMTDSPDPVTSARSLGQTQAQTPTQTPEPSGRRSEFAQGNGTDRKHGRDDDPDGGTETGPAHPVKPQRTPEYENTDGALEGRGYLKATPEQYAALHALTGGKKYPHPTEALLDAVNPHTAPARIPDGFKAGSDLHACLEGVEALRDTHFGRPRPSGQTITGEVEAHPAQALNKRHDIPHLFGEGQTAVNSLIDRVQQAGPGSFATVMVGREGEVGHAVALVHTKDGPMWVDPSKRPPTPPDERIWPAAHGSLPDPRAGGWKVWGSVAGPDRQRPAGLESDPRFMGEFGAPTWQSFTNLFQGGDAGQTTGTSTTPPATDPSVAMHSLVTSPADFLRDTMLSYNGAVGLKQRYPGLTDAQCTAFMERVNSSRDNWFVLAPDPYNPGGFVLTPALEKYIEAGPDDRTLDPYVPHAPAVAQGQTYLSAGYIPYFPGAPKQAGIGRTEIPIAPDPAEPGSEFVFTAVMNGCALAVRPNIESSTFTAWHYQSASGNNGPALQFRRNQQVSDWFGPEGYESGTQPSFFEATNVLWRGPEGWQILSQENSTPPLAAMGGASLAAFRTKPLDLRPPTAERVALQAAAIYTGLAEFELKKMEAARDDKLLKVAWGPQRQAVEREVEDLRYQLLSDLLDLRRQGHLDPNVSFKGTNVAATPLSGAPAVSPDPIADLRAAAAGLQAARVQRGDLAQERFDRMMTEAGITGEDRYRAQQKIDEVLAPFRPPAENKQHWHQDLATELTGHPVEGPEAPGPLPAPDGTVPYRPATANRPIGQDGGLLSPSDEDQARIKNAVPHNSLGVPQRFPDPDHGGWPSQINGGGSHKPGRSTNCADVSLAVVDTYAGHPTAAAARIPDVDGKPSPDGELGGRQRIEAALGAEFADLGNGQEAFGRLEEQLTGLGHGAQAVIITVDADQRSHSWNAINQNGNIVYIDGQTGQHGADLHRRPGGEFAGTQGVFAIMLDPTRAPIALENAPGHDRTAPDRPGMAGNAGEGSSQGAGSPVPPGATQLAPGEEDYWPLAAEPDRRVNLADCTVRIQNPHDTGRGGNPNQPGNSKIWQTQFTATQQGVNNTVNNFENVGSTNIPLWLNGETSLWYSGVRRDPAVNMGTQSGLDHPDAWMTVILPAAEHEMDTLEQFGPDNSVPPPNRDVPAVGLNGQIPQERLLHFQLWEINHALGRQRTPGLDGFGSKVLRKVVRNGDQYQLIEINLE